MRKKILACMLAAVITAMMIPGSLMEKAGVNTEAEAAVTLQNPMIEVDSSMHAGQKITYDCVWFGSYPQTEIVDEADTCGAYGKKWSQPSDYEVNSSLYDTLLNASDWNENGDITLNDGTQYRRIKQSDATFVNKDSVSSAGYYNWNNADEYHYFRYEPIKWRVLNVLGDRILLLADKSLDDLRYTKSISDVTWKTSDIRSWLNGYGSSVNASRKDFTGKNFINSAFDSNERDAIESTSLDNKTTGPYSQSMGGDNTEDKIFLLASYDVYGTDKAASYGFCKDNGVDDEARRSKSTTYSKAMGSFSDSYSNSTNITTYDGNCSWWQRSPGEYGYYAARTSDWGIMYPSGNATGSAHSIRPSLYLSLSSSNLYSYAGTVCTDGTVKEEDGGSIIVRTFSVIYNANGGSGVPENQTKTKGIDLALSTVKPVRSGYTFLGWGTTGSTTNVSYSPGSIYKNDTNVTLYAIWKKTITLTYYANGGSGTSFSQSESIYNSETAYTFTLENCMFSREGYNFEGWSKNPDSIATYGKGEQITISDNTNLYAIWSQDQTQNEYVTLTYSNYNGGENIPASRTVYKNSTVNLSGLTPTKEDYLFLGWSTDKLATSASYAPGDTVDLTSDMTLYAIWKKILTLSYDCNGGSKGPVNQSKTVYNLVESYSFAIDSKFPVREGYTFLGWDTNGNTSNASYSCGDTIEVFSNTILYAVWQRNEMPDNPDKGDLSPSNKKEKQVIYASGRSIAINSKPVSLGAKTSGNGKLTYISSSPSVAAISTSGVITPKKYGVTIITIKAAETSTYMSASKKVTITVVPKKMKITSVKSPSKKTLVLKWKKDSASTKYEVQLCMKSDFKKNTLSRTYGKKVVKQTIKNMKSKTWYVRIRAWKKIGGKTYYGIWSSVKRVKVK